MLRWCACGSGARPSILGPPGPPRSRCESTMRMGMQAMGCWRLLGGYPVVSVVLNDE
jgi:hypothetical protein